jgi:hypothetical protein
MNIIEGLHQHAPRGMLQWAFLENGLNIWAEAHLGDDSEPIKTHGVLPLKTSDWKFAAGLGSIIKELIARARQEKR